MKKPVLRFKGFDGEWVESNVEKECDVLTGFPFPGSEILENGIYPLLRGINITEGKIRHSQEIDRFYSGNVQGLNQYRLNVNDLVIGMDGSKVGRNSAIITERDKDSLLVQRIARLRNYEGKESIRYISILINSSYFTTYVDSLKTSSAIPHISPKDIKNFSFSISPNKTEQKAIGSFFTELDSLIEGKRVKLDKLKKLKLAYLGKMFPKKGSRVPEVRFKGFSGDWVEKRLGDIAEIVGGGTPSTTNPDFWNGDIDWFSPTEVGASVYAVHSQKKITSNGYENCSAKMLPALRTVLFTSRAGIGDSAILKVNACTNQGFQSLVLKDEMDVYFVYSMTTQIKEYALIHASGSTFLEISGKALGLMPILLPSPLEQQRIGAFFQNLDNLIGLQQQELDKLSNIKSACLSKMFA